MLAEHRGGTVLDASLIPKKIRLFALTERASRVISLVVLRPLDNPPNPWASTDVEYLEGEAPPARISVFFDQSRTILSTNDSPDIFFRYSVNPYRGCLHGCAYCYARPSHEYLSFGAGTDFERNIVVKPNAPELLRDAFDAPSWAGELVVFSGVTDCYQPLEASYRLTRGCLEVCRDYKNPASIITKSPLVVRDIDVLTELSQVADVSVTISIPFWDEKTARAIEPYVPPPAKRMRAVEQLAKAGIHVGVNVAPVIPGLSDNQIPAILEAARDAGASYAGWQIVRLPGPVAQVFTERVREAMPLTAEKILRRVRETRDGKISDSRFGTRFSGEGVYADMIRSLFEKTAERCGLSVRRRDGTEVRNTFQRPPRRGDQLGLF